MRISPAKARVKMIGCHDSMSGSHIGRATIQIVALPGSNEHAGRFISGRTTWVMRKVALGNPDKQNPAES
jgi:hypothetical protein